MKETKFRAKSLSTGEWVYGYIFVSEKAWILQTRFCPIRVDPETIGQFTGLKDKKGVDIYATDKYRWLGWEVRSGKQIRPERIYTVRDDTPEHWIEDCYKLWCISTGDSKDTVEVVGNIYENGGFGV